jgi:dethiobiotin synthase
VQKGGSPMKNGIGHGFFITGTDTDIGKTFVSRLLADAFAEWQTVTYMKPIQTGCPRDPSGTLVAPDFDYVMKGRAIMSAELDDHIPYRFEPACSPHLAASRASVMISLDFIREKYLRVSNKKSVTLVEGAGGILTPLSETTSMVDLMLHLRLPVIVVTSPRVGTLNHTLLTIEALEKRGITPAGIVVNSVQPVKEDYIYHDNCRLLRERIHEAAFLEVGYEGEICETVREFCRKISGRS